MGDVVIHLSFFRSVYVVPPQTPSAPRDKACVKHSPCTGQPLQIFLAFALSWKNHRLDDSGMSRQAASAKSGEGVKNSNYTSSGTNLLPIARTAGGAVK